MPDMTDTGLVPPERASNGVSGKIGYGDEVVGNGTHSVSFRRQKELARFPSEPRGSVGHGTDEETRLDQYNEHLDNWKRWGTYLPDRQWGTVREDYSHDGTCWNYFTHEQSRSRAYRWGEDGLFGICDRDCRLCFSYALWNEKDPILKERLFGLTGSEGNHGEDVKELYYHLDATPTASYAKALYKYPQRAYPYLQLVNENAARDKQSLEYKLEDTGIFDDNRYWDVEFEYAKSTSMNILCKITVHNRGPDDAIIHVLPTLWFRNTWCWGSKLDSTTTKPLIRPVSRQEGSENLRLRTRHPQLEQYFCDFQRVASAARPRLLFTDNESNNRQLFETLPNRGGDQSSNSSDDEAENPAKKRYTKDAFHEYVVNGHNGAINPKNHGTKAAAHYVLHIGAGKSESIRVRLYQHDHSNHGEGGSFGAFDDIIALRKKEADEFYSVVHPTSLSMELRNVQRQAFAGMLWNKQFYHYIVHDWLHGDPDQPKPPSSRLTERNSDWVHLYNRDIISMPDKWEYPWYASWDLAFHCLTFANIDYGFAEEQLSLFLSELYMHPNGQLPAYEFALGDVNPPVHAWAVHRLYSCNDNPTPADRKFLHSCFLKLIINFTWWINRKDPEGKNVFSGGFLGLDNIGIFDRSKPLPSGMQLEQADGTAWMFFFCSHMLEIAIELALKDSVYEDMATKFFEHCVLIIDAINSFDAGKGLWDEKDGFYYDQIRSQHELWQMRIRSLVGLVPLFGMLVLEKDTMEQLPMFAKRVNWFLSNRNDLIDRVSFLRCEGQEHRLILAIPTKEQLQRVLGYLFDENEFLSPYGIRSMSKYHEHVPFSFSLEGEELRAEYTPGESSSYLFGGNSNWRGPIWLNMNYLIIRALQRFDYYYGDTLKVEVPNRSGNFMSLKEASLDLCRRLVKLFVPDEDGQRPCLGKELHLSGKYAKDPHFKDLILFHEFFNGDTGRGCGARFGDF